MGAGSAAGVEVEGVESTFAMGGVGAAGGGSSFTNPDKESKLLWLLTNRASRSIGGSFNRESAVGEGL